MRQDGRIDLIPPKIRLVLAEAQTAKPPADIHRRAPHGRPRYSLNSAKLSMR